MAGNIERKIAWYHEIYTIQEFMANFQKSLPQIVKVVGGYYGVDPMHTISSEQVYRIDRINTQKRIIVKDQSAEQLLTIPVNSKIRFKIVNKKLPTKLYPPQTLNNQLDKIRYKDPTMVLQIDDNQVIYENSQGQSNRRHMGELQPIDVYDERYLVGHSIINSNIYPEPVALPAYMTVTMVTASNLPASAGGDGVWKTCLANWSAMAKVGNLENVDIVQDVMVLKDVDLPSSKQYESLAPYEYLRLKDAQPHMYAKVDATSQLQRHSCSFPIPRPSSSDVSQTTEPMVSANYIQILPTDSHADEQLYGNLTRLPLPEVINKSPSKQGTETAGKVMRKSHSAELIHAQVRDTPGNEYHYATNDTRRSANPGLGQSVQLKDNEPQDTNGESSSNQTVRYIPLPGLTAGSCRDTITKPGKGSSLKEEQQQQRPDPPKTRPPKINKSSSQTLQQNEHSVPDSNVAQVSPTTTVSPTAVSESLYSNIDFPRNKLHQNNLSTKKVTSSTTDNTSFANTSSKTSTVYPPLAQKPVQETLKTPKKISASNQKAQPEDRIKELSEIPTNVKDFGIQEVANMLRLLQLGSHVDSFISNDVDGQFLFDLKEPELTALGLNSLESRKLLKFVHEGWRPK